MCQKFRERYTYCASEWAILVLQSARLSNRNGTKQGSKSRAQLVRCGDLLEGWRGYSLQTTEAGRAVIGTSLKCVDATETCYAGCAAFTRTHMHTHRHTRYAVTHILRRALKNNKARTPSPSPRWKGGGGAARRQVGRQCKTVGVCFSGREKEGARAACTRNRDGFQQASRLSSSRE